MPTIAMPSGANGAACAGSRAAPGSVAGHPRDDGRAAAAAAPAVSQPSVATRPRRRVPARVEIRDDARRRVVLEQERRRQRDAAPQRERLREFEQADRVEPELHQRQIAGVGELGAAAHDAADFGLDESIQRVRVRGRRRVPLGARRRGGARVPAVGARGRAVRRGRRVRGGRRPRLVAGPARQIVGHEHAEPRIARVARPVARHRPFDARAVQFVKPQDRIGKKAESVAQPQIVVDRHRRVLVEVAAKRDRDERFDVRERRAALQHEFEQLVAQPAALARRIDIDGEQLDHRPAVFVQAVDRIRVDAVQRPHRRDALRIDHAGQPARPGGRVARVEFEHELAGGMPTDARGERGLRHAQRGGPARELERLQRGQIVRGRGAHPIVARLELAERRASRARCARIADRRRAREQAVGRHVDEKRLRVARGAEAEQPQHARRPGGGPCVGQSRARRRQAVAREHDRRVRAANEQRAQPPDRGRVIHAGQHADRQHIVDRVDAERGRRIRLRGIVRRCGVRTRDHDTGRLDAGAAAVARLALPHDPLDEPLRQIAILAADERQISRPPAGSRVRARIEAPQDRRLEILVRGGANLRPARGRRTVRQTAIRVQQPVAKRRHAFERRAHRAAIADIAVVEHARRVEQAAQIRAERIRERTDGARLARRRRLARTRGGNEKRHEHDVAQPRRAVLLEQAAAPAVQTFAKGVVEERARIGLEPVGFENVRGNRVAAREARIVRACGRRRIVQPFAQRRRAVGVEPRRGGDPLRPRGIAIAGRSGRPRPAQGDKDGNGDIPRSHTFFQSVHAPEPSRSGFVSIAIVHCLHAEHDP